MNILGLLDVPTDGSYKLGGKEVSKLSEDDLAALRREELGFIFQQFNLLPRMTAQENVALPLLYSQKSNQTSRAIELLKKVGLGQRTHHKPNELSGGQQQRVAIARSLINQPKMILADEPTGNLDSVSQTEIMNILRGLNEQGITIVLVTHEEEVAQNAKRLIRMRDGVIFSDEKITAKNESSSIPKRVVKEINSWSFYELMNHFKEGFRTLTANKVRTGLSMLGILIGVAAVVAMLALGRGAQQQIESQLSSLGSNLLVLRAGAMRIGGVSQESGLTTRLSEDDARFLKDRIPTLNRVSSQVNGRAQVTYQNKNWSTQVLGAGPAYPKMHAADPVMGRFFNEQENQMRSRVAVIGMTLVQQLFLDQNPIGEMIKINKVSFQVIGVLPEKGGSGFRNQDDIIVLPVQTAMHRLMGKNYVDSIELEVDRPENIEQAQDSILKFMILKNKVPPSQSEDAFQIFNMSDIQAALSQTSKTMSLLLATIAAISLVVGGIGIMNIMLVSVTERTREIGLRKAIGAKRKDILIQFLAESIVVSAIGGLSGIFLGWLVTVGLTQLSGWTTSVSWESVALSFITSALIGVVFGVYPARKASLLNPIDALRYE